MKKILITGTTGMLGAEVVHALIRHPDLEVYGIGRRRSSLLPDARQFIADLANPQSIQLPDLAPDFIVHTAALTDLGLCERDPNLAERVHVESSKLLAGMVENDGCFIYVSTDSIFEGDNGNYTEQSAPNPLNVYAATKLRGERAVQEVAHKSIVVRTNIYGIHHPFSKSLAEWAYTEWIAGRKINGFTDVFFNPVFTGQLAEIIRWLIDENIPVPVLNVGSNECISKYEFLRLLAEEIGVDPALLEPRLSSDFPSALKRPNNTCLDIKLFSKLREAPRFRDGIRDWRSRL
ncbi:MAG: SDR family oxidoreductase [Bacteroidota bacterium]